MREYLVSHLEIAGQLGKPLVFEEFGLARDQGSYQSAKHGQIPGSILSQYFRDTPSGNR